MHHCLRIPEIVGLWCSHLEESSTIGLQAYSTIVGKSSPWWKRPALNDLAVVARTCRAFHGPALDALWRSSALVNVLRCMPSNLYHCKQSGPSWNVKCDMKLLRPIEVEDWDRVLIYAPRVHHLFSNSHDCDLSKVLPAISACLPPRLFPNLQCVHWGHSGNDFRYLHLFLGPGITELSFTACTPAISFLTTAPQRYSALKTVAIRSDPTVSVFLLLSVDSLDEVGLKHIFLRLGTLPPLLAFNAGPDMRALPVLRRLYLAWAEIGITTRFLRWCKEMPLISLNLEFTTSSTGQEMHSLFDTLSASVLHSSLTKICMMDKYEDRNPVRFPNHLVYSHSIQPLFSFTNFTSVLILTAVGIDLDNSTVSTLVHAWPWLERLELSAYYQYFPATRPRATLECLYSFAAWCPRLTKLSITLNCMATPFLESGSSRVLHSALVYLHVGHSPISTPLSVARFLSGIFTVLRKICDIEDGPMEHHNPWKEVESLLPELLAIREEERIWVQNNLIL
ncbi:hypothetical protein B0H14DRAFT_2775230 [Mycena olivaceomarginata]|nr:hypothetical protein B0H14DRAFT_2775230 [Mycena olivaceomarginata]